MYFISTCNEINLEQSFSLTEDRSPCKSTRNRLSVNSGGTQTLYKSAVCTLHPRTKQGFTTLMFYTNLMFYTTLSPGLDRVSTIGRNKGNQMIAPISLLHEIINPYTQTVQVSVVTYIVYCSTHFTQCSV